MQQPSKDAADFCRHERQTSTAFSCTDNRFTDLTSLCCFPQTHQVWQSAWLHNHHQNLLSFTCFQPASPHETFVPHEARFSLFSCCRLPVEELVHILLCVNQLHGAFAHFVRLNDLCTKKIPVKLTSKKTTASHSLQSSRQEHNHRDVCHPACLT